MSILRFVIGGKCVIGSGVFWIGGGGFDVLVGRGVVLIGSLGCMGWGWLLVF